MTFDGRIRILMFMHLRLMLSLLASASFLSAGAVMDQVSAWTYSGQSGFGSQYFESGLATYDIAAMDDFTTPAGTIDLVQAIMLRYNGTNSYSAVQSWSVQVYSSPAAAGANLTGDIGTQTVLPGGVTLTQNYLGAGQGIALVSIPVSIPVSAGSYWISVIPRMDYSPEGQTGVIVSGSGSPLGLNAEQANPGGSFALGAGNHAAVNPAADLAYMVDVMPACSVPEPATRTAMIGGIAALALFRRRAPKQVSN